MKVKLTDWRIVGEALYIYKNLGLVRKIEKLEDVWVKKARLTFNVVDKYTALNRPMYVRIWTDNGSKYSDSKNYTSANVAIRNMEIFAEEKMPDDIKDWVHSRAMLAMIEKSV